MNVGDQFQSLHTFQMYECPPPLCCGENKSGHLLEGRQAYINGTFDCFVNLQLLKGYYINLPSRLPENLENQFGGPALKRFS